MRAEGDEPRQSDDAAGLAFAAGAAAWPGVLLAREAFCAAWEGRGARGGTGDLFLAIACDRAVQGAWEALDREFAPRLRGLLRKRGASHEEATEMLNDLPGYLCQAPADGRARTRIGTYDGSGSLFSWLAVIALRGVNQRRGGAERTRRVDAPVSQVATVRTAPGRGVIAEETARRFQSALAAAWTALTPRERLAVLLRHRDGLAGKEVARLMGVGEPRVSRLLEAGLSRLKEALHRLMPSAMSAPDSVVWNAMAGVLAQHLATLRSSPHYLAEAGDA